MKWSFRLLSIAGIRIEVHATFLIFLAWAAWTQERVSSVPLVLGEILVFFLCVLLHELGHALSARHYGIATREIVLLPIGGVARMERMSEKPGQEIVIALAGPGVTLMIIALIGGLMIATGVPPESLFDGKSDGFLEWLLLANTVMLLFNLLPAFPMDGGRVLRAVLANAMPYARATRIAAQIGQGFALLFAVVGVVQHNVFLVVAALFVFLAAGDERALVQTRASLAGIPVSEAMVVTFVSLETRHELQHAVDLMLAGDQQDFPVLEGGRYLGMLARHDLIKGLREEGPQAPVGRVVRMDVEPIEASWPLDRAMQVMRAARHGAVPVMMRGQLVGLLTLENIGELLMVQEARQRHAGIA